jgi:hypothetical protein
MSGIAGSELIDSFASAKVSPRIPSPDSTRMICFNLTSTITHNDPPTEIPYRVPSSWPNKMIVITPSHPLGGLRATLRLSSKFARGLQRQVGTTPFWQLSGLKDHQRAADR